ncbi:hypothetical protein OAI_00930 [Vibrio cyclitrophicus FF160]|uniref:hypothetical protein n=1 Tax=Vibrio cyclitrophicus TaxID=47951 RepID=UPI00030E3D94|nr:hypothetical protein [Vibrio cyclitrophicus]OEE82852.1 hypothetical protein OAI_00930 [Vibrio cyclitrophicus FF160]
MDKPIPSKKLFSYAYDLEQFEATSVAELVIEKARLAGFITDKDCEEDRQNLAWIMRVTKLADHAYNLDLVADGESIEVKIQNLDRLIKQREEKEKEILQLLAKRIADAAPSYKW